MSKPISIPVVRYVPTYINKDGMRTLMLASRGEYTYETPEAAQAWIDAIRTGVSTDTLKSLFGSADTYEVRPCDCWPVHFDPMGVWFDK